MRSTYWAAAQMSQVHRSTTAAKVELSLQLPSKILFALDGKFEFGAFIKQSARRQVSELPADQLIP